jgi:transglutaminase-like putative cysteine protease
MPDSTETAAQTARSDDPADYLDPTYYLDFDKPELTAYAKATVGDAQGDVEAALRLYYAVRDGFRYDPYAMQLIPAAMTASHTFRTGRGFCVNKAALLAALARAVGIPARVGYADVRNHLASKRFLDMLGTNLFVWHGYVELWLEGRWVKCTPAFNLELCRKFNVLPLEWDGRTDSLFHPFDAAGNRHMEYVNEHGVFADVPFDAIEHGFRTLYPVFDDEGRMKMGGDFGAEGAADQRATR